MAEKSSTNVLLARHNALARGSMSMGGTKSHIDELLRLVRAGNVAAVAEMATVVHAYAHGVARAMLRSLAGQLAGKLDASDVAQSAVGEALARLAEFKGGGGEWMFYVKQIARHRVLNRLRRPDVARARVLSEEDDAMLQIAEGQARPDVMAQRREEAALALAAVERLQPNYRLIIDMRIFRGLTNAEAAAEMATLDAADLSRLWQDYLKHNGLQSDDDVFAALVERIKQCNEQVARQWLTRALKRIRQLLGANE